MERRASIGYDAECPVSAPGRPTCLADGSGTKRHVSPDWRPGPGVWADWKRYSPSGNRYNPHASPPRTEPEIVWTQEYDGNPSSRSIAIADGTAFGVFDSELYALDNSDGEVLWRKSISRGGTVFYVDGRLYHGTSGSVEALTLAGDVEWRLDEEAASVAGETDGYVYTTTSDGRLCWHDADSGERLGWTDTVVMPIIVADGRVYGFTEESIVAYVHDGEALSEQWRTPFSGPHKSGLSVLAEGALYRQELGDLLASQRGPVHRGNDYLETYSLDGERLDREVWSENRTISGLVVSEGVEFLLVEEFDREGGYESAHLIARDTDERWRKSFPAPASRPLVADDTVIISDGEKTLLAFDAVNGERLWKLEGVGGGVAIVEDTIYVVGDEFTALRAA